MHPYMRLRDWQTVAVTAMDGFRKQCKARGVDVIVGKG